ncbi:MAG: recombination protein RecR [Candidatus Aenigmatarchaeota archaeon]|nr:MAG: recombination protein RecR [Candidatus Aenigmarchaeota archaeon]
MSAYSELVQRLVKELSRLPGIGPRSAERIVFHVLKLDEGRVKLLSDLLLKVKKEVFFCQICNNLSEDKICHICRDEAREQNIICVVEEPKDVISLEKSGSFKGVYHVLLGALSPLSGVGPKELKIKELEERIKKGSIEEVIIATNFNTEGEATALYLAKILKPYSIKITRIARGIPIGSNLEYVDRDTLACAVGGRQEIK